MRIVARRHIPSISDWSPKRQKIVLWHCLAVLGTALFLLWFALGIQALFFGYHESQLNSWCGNKGESCGIVSGTLSPLLSFALLTLVFLMTSYPQAVRKVRRRARRNPRSLVPTAGTVLEDVVGRQELCQVLIRTLHDRAIRRPILLVGSVGAGKTAVLVQLTRMLAEKGAVPVPIQLRSVSQDADKLDFAEAGRKRFCEMVNADLISGAQGERIWRQLITDDKAVIVADGLEELFTQGPQERERDVAIRNAIRLAERQKLPLVIASRPHAPLEDSDAAIIDLEPLSEEAAIEYLSGDRNVRSDEVRLDWIVETAVVSEAPLYLQITRGLRQHHRLEYLNHRKEWEDLDTRHADRYTLRLRLLETWKNALANGNLYKSYALPTERRNDTIEVISALACIGLLKDSLEVGLAELVASGKDGSNGPCGRNEIIRFLVNRVWQYRRSKNPQEDKYPEIWAALNKKINTDEEGDARVLPYDSDILGCVNRLSLYAAQGERLGLVEAKGDSIRFPHSIMQAYLGSRFISEVSDKHLAAALQEPKPGRELLIALVLNSRAVGRTVDDWVRQQRSVIKSLLNAAKIRCDVKAFDLYSTALQVDQIVPGNPSHTEVADSLKARWSAIRLGDRKSIEEAKIRLVHRFGEVLRAIADAANDPGAPRNGKQPAYQEFLEIAFNEPLYQVRLAIAQELGACGDGAFEMIRKLFPLSVDGHPSEMYDPWAQYEARYHEAQYDEARAFESFTHEHGPEGKKEAPASYYELARKHREHKERIRREFMARAWLVPMMVGSVTAKHQRQAKERIDLWLKHLDCERPGSDRAELPLILEIALAQGFKSSANRRRRHRSTNRETRDFMVQKAEILLSRARHWYSQMTLIHALCLWELPDSSGETITGRREPPAANASEAVTRWLSMAGSKRDPRSRKPEDLGADGRERLHPFVAEAGELAALALETGHPEKYLWIDEKGAMDNVGSTPAKPSKIRQHNLWIPPSVGWTTLHPRAQRLLADVLLLLNLAERDGEPDEVDSRIDRANRTDLPPCLRRDRSPLRPERTVGMADDAAPGSTCSRDCPFELCPYPAKGQQPRAELPEPFCRQQQALLRAGTLRRTAPWQDIRSKELLRFWGTMARRSRTVDE